MPIDMTDYFKPESVSGKRRLELDEGITLAIGSGSFSGGSGMYVPISLASTTLTDLANVAEASGVQISGVASAAMIDLTDFTQVKFLCWVQVQGSASALIRAQYGLIGQSFVALGDSLSLFGAGLKATAWSGIPTAARAPVLLAGRAWLGDGTTDPVVRALGIMVR